MTTENQVQEPQVIEAPNTPELTPVQQKALEQGWKPKDQFEGDEADFIDAPEFVRRGELFGKIEKQSRELKQLRDAMEAFKQHHSKVKESEYRRALKAAEAAKREAFENHDTDRFFALEQHIDSIKEEAAAVQEAAKAVPVENSTPPALEAWMGKNSWYQSNRAMTALADRLGAELHAKGYTLDQALREIDAEVRKEFPDKFTTRRPPSPEGSSRSGARSDKADYKPTEDERRIAKKFAATGIMTEAEYYKELKRAQGE